MHQPESAQLLLTGHQVPAEQRFSAMMTWPPPAGLAGRAWFHDILPVVPALHSIGQVAAHGYFALRGPQPLDCLAVELEVTDLEALRARPGPSRLVVAATAAVHRGGDAGPDVLVRGTVTANAEPAVRCRMRLAGAGTAADVEFDPAADRPVPGEPALPEQVGKQCLAEVVIAAPQLTPPRHASTCVNANWRHPLLSTSLGHVPAAYLLESARQLVVAAGAELRGLCPTTCQPTRFRLDLSTPVAFDAPLWCTAEVGEPVFGDRSGIRVRAELGFHQDGRSVGSADVEVIQYL